MWIHCSRTRVFVSEKAFVHIYWLNKIQMIQMFSPFSSLFFLPPPPLLFCGESFNLYSSFWLIFTLHLLIIWTFTWVLVPSATFPGLLWVALAKETQFRRLLHINAASKVAVFAFNAVVSVISQIFPYLQPFLMSVKRIPITELFWKVTLIAALCILHHAY